MSTRKQKKKKDYKYCLDCGRKFVEDDPNLHKHIVNRYEPRDCIYGTFDENTGKAICHDCFIEKNKLTIYNFSC